ncbi:hypothetical protein ACFY93_02075 [Streptomyces sp. NPDC008313]|uniref:hypothetical protein n=1 Tax=Streptomyces sp. NPDC008313 TaxID=3364826 RepID=UPI0036E766A4
MAAAIARTLGWRTGRGRDKVAEQSVGMRIDQLPGDITGPASQPPLKKPDLASSPAEKKAAAKAIEDNIEPDTRTAGDWAETETDAAVKAFRDGWATSGALKKAHTAWDDQVKNLMNRLSSEKTALRQTHTVLHGTDAAVGNGSQSISVFHDY